MNKEILLSADFIDPEETIDTIYFGGGTPSLLSTDELKNIFHVLKKKFIINEEAEITLEANPDDIHPAGLKQWLDMGINRLSLGVQSFIETELRWMNRVHNAEQSLTSIDEIQQAGFTNFSVDLIYGSPLLSNDDFEANLEIIYNKKIPHISCYALTVEPKTALNTLIEQKRSLPVNSDKQAEQFVLLMKKMQQHGYEHYEISNFSIPGMRSKHNSSYWEGKPYYGFGASAHSFDGNNKRRWNIDNNSLYIQSLEKNSIPYTEEILTDAQQLNELIMISLRTMEGLNTRMIEKKFGKAVTEKIFMGSKEFIAAGSMLMHEEQLVLTEQGKLLADGIAANLFF